MFETILTYFNNFFKKMESDELVNYPDPAPPGDLGSSLTQEEIDFIKTLKKEMEERFTEL